MSRRCTGVRVAPVISPVIVMASGSPMVPGTDKSPEGFTMTTQSGVSARINGFFDRQRGSLKRSSCATACPARSRSMRGFEVVTGESGMPSNLTSQAGDGPHHHSSEAMGRTCAEENVPPRSDRMRAAIRLNESRFFASGDETASRSALFQCACVRLSPAPPPRAIFSGFPARSFSANE